MIVAFRFGFDQTRSWWSQNTIQYCAVYPSKVRWLESGKGSTRLAARLVVEARLATGVECVCAAPPTKTITLLFVAHSQLSRVTMVD